MTEDVLVDVYEYSDLDWALVGLNGHYGYAPTNYIEKAVESFHDAASAERLATVAATKKHVAYIENQEPSTLLSLSSSRPISSHGSQSLPDHSHSHGYQLYNHTVPPPQSCVASPVSAYIHPRPSCHGERGQNHGREDASRQMNSPKSPHSIDSDDSDGPKLPLRSLGEQGRASSPPIPPRFRTYPVLEVDAKKKRAATLGLGPNRIILVPDKSTRPREEWAIDNMTGYNHEGKHVFLDVKYPTKSLDLHAGSTYAAEEIVSALGELRGIRKAVGLDEVIAAANDSKKTDIGTVLYDFPSQGDDEVSATAGDEVIILDDSNDEWWLVRRQVNGTEGVLPSSYVERGRKSITSVSASPTVGTNMPRAQYVSSTSTSRDVGVSKVPERRSSLAQPTQGRKSATVKSSMPQLPRLRYRKEQPISEILLTIPFIEPDTSQIRTWTDRTGSFKVEAQFIGCKDGKIHLHKINGVKIAVPVLKMSMNDLQYVEDKTGISLDEDKPLSEILKEQRKKNSQIGIVVDRTANPSKIGTSVTSTSFWSTRKSDYDWFDFFLSCGVEVNNCQRYAMNFQKDEMDESSLESISSDVMRTLGMKEGDILRVIKKLDDKYSGQVEKIHIRDEGDTNQGKNMFTDESGNLKSLRARPPPAIQTGAVDPKALQAHKESLESAAPASVSGSPPPMQHPMSSCFDDDVWAPKHSKQPSPALPHLPKQLAVAHPLQMAQPMRAQQSTPIAGALSDIATLLPDTVPIQPTIKSPVPSIPIISQPSTSARFNHGPQPPAQLDMFGGDFSSSEHIHSDLALARVGVGPPLGSYQAGTIIPPALAILGITSPAPPPPPTRPLSAPQTFAPEPIQTMSSTFTGDPNTLTYRSMTSLDSQQLPATAMGRISRITPQVLYKPNGHPTRHLTNNGISQRSGYEVQQSGTGLLPPSLPPFQTFPNAPNSSYSLNSTLPPPLIPRPASATLLPQYTGPVPQVRFGVAQPKLKQQPTGRANLNKASGSSVSLNTLGSTNHRCEAPDNPFGFE